VMECQSDFKLTNIFKRIQKNQETFQARFERKMEAETNHLMQKYGASTAVNGTTTTS
jgi:aspartate-semialdehyde dehydrogenase